MGPVLAPGVVPPVSGSMEPDLPTIVRAFKSHLADYHLPDQVIEDFRATGALRCVPLFLALKAEALHLADRTFEALEAIREAEGFVERFEERVWRADLYRLRGVLLTAMGADATQIEGSFCAAIRTAREQKSISLEKRAEASYAEYRSQKARAPGGQAFRLSLW